MPLVSFATPVPVTEQIGGYTYPLGEDADYITSTPSYTKIDADGSDLPDEATTWAMVRDNVTGLIWGGKTIGGVVHGNGNTFKLARCTGCFLSPQLILKTSEDIIKQLSLLI